VVQPPQIVNGYVCYDCADVALAQKDINPAHPPGSPSNPTGSTPNGLNNPNGTPGAKSSPSVLFGGAAAKLAGQAPPSAIAPPYQPGAQVSVSA